MKNIKNILLYIEEKNPKYKVENYFGKPEIFDEQMRYHGKNIKKMWGSIEVVADFEHGEICSTEILLNEQSFTYILENKYEPPTFTYKK